MEVTWPAYCADAYRFLERLTIENPSLTFSRPIHSSPPNRCIIIDREKEVTLSVPVAGGAALLKREHNLNSIYVSNHGDWRRVHNGAFTTAYSRTPFFMHYRYILDEAWALESPSLGELNRFICNAVEKALHFETIAHSLVSLPIDPRFSDAPPLHITMLDPLFRYGPEAIFRLRAALSSK